MMKCTVNLEAPPDPDMAILLDSVIEWRYRRDFRQPGTGVFGQRIEVKVIQGWHAHLSFRLSLISNNALKELRT